ncbi:helix-turn-helix domain-containing protein [Sabulibacter ruber]|uniref:helix-turn-helix domain-containing protein n=1 Tax=Sabulibacter ruber TaxID=2811901 RepID=UPI001A959A06|nr:helix-turn-helix domain-containing protein [Sabulibacter ruber]
MNIDILTKNDLNEFEERFFNKVANMISPLQMSKPLLKPKQVMEELNCSFNTLKKLIKEGVLVPVQYSDQNRFRAEDIERIKFGN